MPTEPKPQGRRRGPRFEGTSVVWHLGAGPAQIRAITRGTLLFGVAMLVTLTLGFLVDPVLGLVVLALGFLGLIPIVLAVGALALDWPRGMRVELRSDRLILDQWWAEPVLLEEIVEIREARWPSPALILRLEDGWWARIPLGDHHRPSDVAAVRVPIERAAAHYRAFLAGKNRGAWSVRAQELVPGAD